MTRILVVDDERLLVKGLKRSLEAEGYEVEVAYDGVTALDMLGRLQVDLVILDIMLPGLDGLEVCRRLRQNSNIPIIMLTAKGDDVDRIVGLELGADDYLPKPFNTRELLARIRAVLRRAAPQVTGANIIPAEGMFRPADVLTNGSLELRVPEQRVFIDGREIELTAREFDLLHLLASHPGRIFTREMLLEMVWGSLYYGDTRVVDVYIRRLRQKVEPDPGNPRLILTRWGTGYYFQRAD